MVGIRSQAAMKTSMPCGSLYSGCLRWGQANKPISGPELNQNPPLVQQRAPSRPQSCSSVLQASSSGMPMTHLRFWWPELMRKMRRNGSSSTSLVGSFVGRGQSTAVALAILLGIIKSDVSVLWNWKASWHFGLCLCVVKAYGCVKQKKGDIGWE